MNDPVKAREALYEFSAVLQTHRLKFREVIETASQSYEMLNNELEGSVAEEIYRAWSSLKDWVEDYLHSAAMTESKVREQADQLSSF